MGQREQNIEVTVKWHPERGQKEVVIHVHLGRRSFTIDGITLPTFGGWLMGAIDLPEIAECESAVPGSRAALESLRQTLAVS